VAADAKQLRRRKPGRLRRFITLTIASALLVSFVLISAWGVARSDWLYGTYGGLRQQDWDEIARLRADMIRLGAAPGAIAALDDALLIPRPSTEDVIYDLQKAVLILQSGQASEAIRGPTLELRALISQLEARDGTPFTVWQKPTMDSFSTHSPQE
jgi:hypothetical protein